MSTDLAASDYATHPSSTLYRRELARAFGLDVSRGPRETWRTWRGHHVHIDDWAPLDRRPRGTVILVHGAGGNGRVLAPFALPAVDAGFAVRAPDLPGYGLTRVRRGARVDYSEWVELVADLADDAASRGPVVIFGMSVGGMTALWAAQRARTPIAGVIATTLLDLRDERTFLGAARGWIGRLSLFAFRTPPPSTVSPSRSWPRPRSSG
jgi:alpha-beta hydrolase superfamily lysophospholipase